MKQLILFKLSILMVLGLECCNKEQDVEINQDYSLTKTVTIPKGTFISFNKKRQTYHVKLPEEYAFVAENPDGSLSNLFTEGDLTCTCTSPSNGGCSPFVANGPKGEIIGCSMNNCTSCIGKLTTVRGEEFDINRVNILDKENPIQFILTLDEYRQLREPNAKIFEIKAFVTNMQNFISGFQSEHLDELRAMKDINYLKDIDYILAPINFYGYRMYLPVDKSLKLNVINPLINELVNFYEDEGTYGCRCESNEKGCKLKTKFIPLIGSAVWCEAGSCGSCTLVMN